MIVRMTVAYDGTRFHGMAANPGVRTVAGVLAEALERRLRHPVDLTVAGRTDAGVHGWGQVVSFTTPAEGLHVAALARSVTRMCGPEVVVRQADVALDGFDARRSATARRYRYQVLTEPVPDPFLATTAWHVPGPLDRDALDLACDPFVGEHDFTSFCRRPKGEPDAPMVRRVRQVRWEADRDRAGLLRCWIEADAFCQQQVRSMVGTMVDIGRGRRHAGEVLGMLRARDRAAAGTVAPPHGLCLWEVRYDEIVT